MTQVEFFANNESVPDNMINEPADTEKAKKEFMDKARNEVETKSAKAYESKEPSPASMSGSRPPPEPKPEAKPAEEKKEPSKLRKAIGEGLKKAGEAFSDLSEAQGRNAAEIIRGMGPKGKGNKESKNGSRRVGG